MTPLLSPIVIDSIIIPLFLHENSANCMCFPRLGVIYLKNMITQYWSEGDNTHSEAPGSNIPEEDRQFIRDHIVEAIIQSPERIR